MEIVEDFDEQSYNNNGKPWKLSRILRVKPNFFIFVIFSSFMFIFARSARAVVCVQHEVENTRCDAVNTWMTCATLFWLDTDGL